MEIKVEYFLKIIGRRPFSCFTLPSGTGPNDGAFALSIYPLARLSTARSSEGCLRSKLVTEFSIEMLGILMRIQL